MYGWKEVCWREACMVGGQHVCREACMVGGQHVCREACMIGGQSVCREACWREACIMVGGRHVDLCVCKGSRG